MKVIFSILVLCALGFHSATASDSANPKGVIVLKRYPAQGGGAAYTITLYKDGRFRWEGKSEFFVLDGEPGRIASDSAAVLFVEFSELLLLRKLVEVVISDAPHYQIISMINSKEDGLIVYDDDPKEKLVFVHHLLDLTNLRRYISEE